MNVNQWRSSHIRIFSVSSALRALPKSPGKEWKEVARPWRGWMNPRARPQNDAANNTRVRPRFVQKNTKSSFISISWLNIYIYMIIIFIMKYGYITLYNIIIFFESWNFGKKKSSWLTNKTGLAEAITSTSILGVAHVQTTQNLHENLRSMDWFVGESWTGNQIYFPMKIQ